MSECSSRRFVSPSAKETRDFRCTLRNEITQTKLDAPYARVSPTRCGGAPGGGVGDL